VDENVYVYPPESYLYHVTPVKSKQEPTLQDVQNDLVSALGQCNGQLSSIRAYYEEFE